MASEKMSSNTQNMEGSDDGSDLIMLMDKAQLQKLALLLRNNEEALMVRAMKSQYERIEYLKSVNDCYDNTIALLDKGTTMAENFAKQNQEQKASIAQDILKYLKFFLNMSMQVVRNCCLRVTCIEKIKTHFDSLANELAELDHENVTDVGRFAEEVSMYKKCAWEYSSKCRSGSARALSKAYSMLVKQEGVSFPELVNRQKNKLGFVEEFDDLEDVQKLKVYNSIIEESGRAKIPKLEIATTTIGVTVMMVTAGIMVWDIFTAEHKIEAILQNSLTVLAEVGSFFVQVAVEAEVSTAVADMELGAFIVSLAGFVTGLLAGFIFMAGVGFLMDLIFGSGGNTPPPVTNLKFHTAQMPDGMAFANQIAHDSD